MRIFFVTLAIVYFIIPAYGQYSIRISPVDSNIYVYTSYGDAGNYKNVDANAVIVVSGNDAVVFDTPWDDTQAKQLLSFVRDSLRKNIVLSVITHAHVDRIGSIATMKENNIPAIGYRLIAAEAKRHGHPSPDYLFYNTDTTLLCGDLEIVAYYPGAGHTIDNIVIYIPSKRFLYGGCFIKSGHSGSIGNIEDADITAWPASLKNMQQHFGKTGINMVIPGHGSWKSDKAIENTLRLLSDLPEKGY